MIGDLASGLAMLKKEFAATYSGSSHIQEVVPRDTSGIFPAKSRDIKRLHDFAGSNPIYYDSYETDLLGVSCTVYEGDINEYWLGSIKHDSSTQPFYPTWIASAYVIALAAAEAGCTEGVDIGSGDGRIAYCADMLGIKSYGIEIDPALSGLQADIAERTSSGAEARCADATRFGYRDIGLKRPAFFIGGLARMGGEMLASGIIGALNDMPKVRQNALVVLAGTYAKKHLSADSRYGGWDSIITESGMSVADTIMLPTVWTFDQADDTPYIYARFSDNSKPN